MFAFCEPQSQQSELNNDEIPSDVRKPGVSRPIAFSLDSSTKVHSDLVNVARQLRECADSREDFLCAFDEWEVYRKASIEFLTEAFEELNKIHFNTNCAKAAGSTGAIISGCIGIAGAVKMLAEESATSLQLVADCGNVVSAAVTNGAAITELGLTQSYMNKAKRILQKDSERFAAIRVWFESSEDAKRAINVVSNCNLIADVFQKLVAVIPVVIGTYSSLASQVDGAVNEVVKVLDKNVSRSEVEKIILLCASVCSNPEMLKIVQHIHQTIRSAPTVMPVITALVKIPCAWETVSRYISGTSGKKVSKQEAIIYGIFQGVNVAIELFSMKLLIEDFQQGSISEQAAVLKEVKEQLQMELNLISKVHRRLERS